MPPIHGQQFLDWLKAADIIPARTSRVVIEASCRDVVRIYCEQFGTEEMISIEPPPELRGAKVVVKE